MDENNGKNTLKTIVLISSIGGLPLFLMIFVIFVVVLLVLGLFNGGDGGGSVCVTLPTVDSTCKSITVEGKGTMDLDEYVAGVVNAEIGGMSDETFEMYKAGAVAARSYVLAHASKDSSGNCTVTSGQSFQVYKENPDSNMKQAAEETSGMVMVKDGNIFSTQYDAFCYTSKDSNNYEVCQGHGTTTSIPISWVEQHVPASYRAKPNDRSVSHGNGMSQYGAYYLVTEKQYDYQKILDHFYGDEGATLASINNSSSNCSAGNLHALSSYTLNGEGLKKLNKQLNDSEITSLNNFIEKEVTKATYGTGDAVAAAGQSLAYGLEQSGYYLGYYWGGGHGENGTGVINTWGKNVGIAYTTGNNTPTGPEYGVDCSGFVSWAIRNACSPNFGSVTAENFMGFGNEITLKEAKPGDVLANSGHVILVVKNNGDGSVTTVEASISKGVVFRNYSSASGYKVVDMSKWYSNNCTRN